MLFIHQSRKILNKKVFSIHPDVNIEGFTFQVQIAF